MSDLIAQLRDPDYAGVMQHCRSSSEIHTLFHGAASEIERQAAALQVAAGALRLSQQAINDWVCTYASDMVGEADADEAQRRVTAAGGTLMYTAEVGAIIAEALSQASGEAA